MDRENSPQISQDKDLFMNKRIRLHNMLVIAVVAALLPFKFAGQVLAQGSSASEGALEARMQAELTQLQQQLRQLRAEDAEHEAKAKQKGIPIPATVLQFRQAQVDLEHGNAILEQLPNHYSGQRAAAMKDIHQALIDIEHCKAIDWKLAEKGQH